MPEFSPFFELLMLLPLEAMQRAASHYRDLADRLEWEVWRRQPETERARALKKRLAKVYGAAESAAAAIAAGEPREAAVSRSAASHGVEPVAVEAALAGARRRLRGARDELTVDLAKKGLGDAEIAAELKARGYRTSQPTMTRALQRGLRAPGARR
jgi:hypothetical protein